MTTVYHGATAEKIAKLAGGISSIFGGLYVTESADLAQRYADSSASRVVSHEVRRVAGSAVATLTTDAPVVWRRRNTSATLDVCEATIESWQVEHVTVYTTAFDLRASVAKVNDQWVKLYDYLSELYGDRLEIVVVEK